MHELDDQVAERGCQSAASRSEASLAGDRIGVAERTAGTFSADRLAVHERDRDGAVLSVQGELDLATAPALEEALLPILERETGPVVLDLSDVSFMDSTGVHVLVDTLRRLKTQGRPLAIVCREAGQVHRILALTGLLDALTVHHSRESAVTGADDVLRSEPDSNRCPSGPALSQSPPHIGLANGQAAMPPAR